MPVFFIRLRSCITVYAVTVMTVVKIIIEIENTAEKCITKKVHTILYLKLVGYLSFLRVLFNSK